MFNRRSLLAFAIACAIATPAFAQTRSRWTTEEAAAWREGTGWLVGANFGPAYAINQLLMAKYELPRLPLSYLPIGAVVLWLLGQASVFGPARRGAAVPPAVATRSA